MVIKNIFTIHTFYSDDYTIANKYDFSKYYHLMKMQCISVSFYQFCKFIRGDDIRISKRIIYLVEDLRGFEAGKIGPKMVLILLVVTMLLH